MTHGSLFSGIGGFDLAAEWMGWKNVFHCEINPFGRKVLNHYWPKAISYEDITKTDFTVHRGSIDVLTGGFPCQPYSVAGLRKGKEDERHLWPEMLRAIREIKPRWIVGENVLGLVSWNGGLVFEEVQADLEAEGYEVQPYILPAASVDAPHKRDRVWFVAFNSKLTANVGSNTRASQRDGVAMEGDFVDPFGWKQGSNNTEPSGEHGVPSNPHNHGPHGTEKRQGLEKGNDGDTTRAIEAEQLEGCSIPCATSFTHTQSKQSERIESCGQPEACKSGQGEYRGSYCNVTFAHSNSRRQSIEEYRETEPGRLAKKSVSNYWQNFPTQPPVRDGNDGFPSELDGITFPKWRNESIMAGGNAIVPQVVYNIFKSIKQYELITKQ